MIRATVIVTLTLAVSGCADDLSNYAAKVAADHERNRVQAVARCRQMQARAIADESASELKDANSCWRITQGGDEIWSDMQTQHQRQNAAAAAAISAGDSVHSPPPYAPPSVNNSASMPPIPPAQRTDPLLPTWQPPRSTQVIHCVGVIRIDPGAPPEGCE